MGAGVDFSKSVDVDVRVNLGRFQTCVTQHFLNIANVGTTPVHVSGTGVAEEVAGAGFYDAAALHEFLDPVAEVGRCEAGAVAAQEHC